jgi:hypothetical protein
MDYWQNKRTIRLLTLVVLHIHGQKEMAGNGHFKEINYVIPNRYFGFLTNTSGLTVTWSRGNSW